MAKGRWRRRKGVFGWSVDAGRRGAPLLMAGFFGAWLTRFFRDDGPDPQVVESLQDPLLIAVSSAAPVALPDASEPLLEAEARFVIALAPHEAPRTVRAHEPTLGLAPERPASAPEEDDDDEGLVWWDRGGASAESGGYLTDIAPHPGTSASAPGEFAETPAEKPTGNIASETRLPQSQDEALSPERPDVIPDDIDPSQRPALEDERFVSITQLNEQMGPPAPEEDDDDEAGWLWWGDGVLAWFATATAGLLGGTGGGAGAAAGGAGSEVVRSGLEIAFAAGPFVDGELTLKAVDSNGDTLFTYSGEAVGSTLTDGVTLVGISTETVLGESVITGLDVEFDDFAGRVFLQVDEGSAYLDEALSVNALTADEARTALDTPLRAVAEVPSGDTGFVNISPFTELAIRIIQDAKGMEVSLETPDSAVLADTQDLYDSAAERVQEIVGVDIRTTRPVAVNQESFVDNAFTDISQYGLKLAALSQFGEDQTLGVTDALDRLIEAVEPSADDETKAIVFSKPGAALNNRSLLTDSQDLFVLADEDVAASVIDAVRPAFAPVIDPVVVVEAGTVTINGTAFFFDTDNSAGDQSALSVFMALGDSTVFTVDGVEGSGSGALELSGGQPLDDGSIPSGDWSLRIDDLDQGVYTFDAYVVDEGANVTRSAPASGDTTPQLVLLDGTSGDGGSTEIAINLTEGDTADAISASTALLAVDLGSGDVVSASTFEVSATSNPLNLTNDELKDLITLEDGTGLGGNGRGQSVALPGGTLLDGPSNLASLQWAFAGDADVFDALASGDTFTATYTLTGDDQDSNRSNEARLEVTITGTNDAPDVVVADAAGDEDTPIELTGLSVADVDENADLTVVLSVADGDLSIDADVSGGLSAGDISGGGTDVVTLTGTVEEINATLSAAGSVTYQGDADFSGIDTLTMTITDSFGATGTDQANITIAGINDTPAFSQPSNGLIQDGPLPGSGDFTSSDLSGDFSDFVTDPDAGDTLTFSITAGAVGTFGTLSLNADGTYLYTPDVAAVDALGVGESGRDDFLIDVVDSEGSGDTGFFTVDVVGENDRPTVATALTASGDEDSGVVSLNLLTGASDLDTTDSLSAASLVYQVDDVPTASGGSTAPSGLSLSGDTVTVDTDAAAFQSLAAGVSREIIITYSVTDDSGQANNAVEQTATITVTGVNDAPVNTINGASTDEDAPVAISGLAVTDTDADESLTLTLSVANGTLEIQDSDLGSAGAQVSNNNSASVTLSGSADQINATLSELLAVIYTPAENFFGTDTLTMTTTDSEGATDIDAESITVGAVDDTRPDAALTAAKHIFRVGDVISQISVSFTEAVTGLETQDFEIIDNTPDVDVIQTMVFDDSGEEQLLSIKPVESDPGLAQSTFVTIQLLADTVSDAAGNGNNASNTERLIVLGDDAISGDVRDEILDDTFKRSDESDRLIDEGEFIFGDAGDDVLFGYGGDDILMGAMDDDVLIGGEGVDTFLAGAGDDFMAGGAGDDVYLLDEFGREIVSENIFIGNDGEDQVALSGVADDYLINRVTLNQITQINDLMQDENGNFRGLEIPDLQLDTSLPVLRIDFVTDQGRQTDFVQAESLKFTDITLVYEEISSYHDANGDGSRDLLPFVTVADSGDAFVHNGGGRPAQETGANYLLGKDADDRLIGGLGDDDIRGGAGNDVLVSLGGKGLLEGGSGDDTLIGLGLGGGDPTELTGGAGADQFVIAPQQGVSSGVIIKDFSLDDGDLINIDGLLKNLQGEVATSTEVFNSLQNIDYLNDVAEIDLSAFYVADTDADTPAEYTEAGGVLRIEFESGALADGSLTDGSIVATDIFTDTNPVGSEQWWQDLINNGGFA